MSMFYYISEATGLLMSSPFTFEVSVDAVSDMEVDSGNVSDVFDEDSEENYISTLVDGEEQVFADSDYVSFWLDEVQHFADASMEILYDADTKGTREIEEGEELVSVQVEEKNGDLLEQLVAADMFGDEHELEEGDVIDWESRWFGKGEWEVADEQERTPLDLGIRLAQWFYGLLGVQQAWRIFCEWYAVATRSVFGSWGGAFVYFAVTGAVTFLTLSEDLMLKFRDATLGPYEGILSEIADEDVSDEIGEEQAPEELSRLDIASGKSQDMQYIPCMSDTLSR